MRYVRKVGEFLENGEGEGGSGSNWERYIKRNEGSGGSFFLPFMSFSSFFNSMSLSFYINLKFVLNGKIGIERSHYESESFSSLGTSCIHAREPSSV